MTAHPAVIEPVVSDFISYYLQPHEIPHIKSMVKWFYQQGIIPQPSADALGRYALAKLSQEYIWMSADEVKNAGK